MSGPLRAGAPVRRGAWTLLVLDAVWLCVIFGHSLRSAAASTVESRAATAAVQRVLGEGPPWLEVFLRKAAHFAEFFVLGCLLAATAAALWGAGRLKRAAAGLALAGLVAGLADETLQLASPGRSAQVTDVWLDWAGYLCGAAALAVWLWARGRRLARHAGKQR